MADAFTSSQRNQATTFRLNKSLFGIGGCGSYHNLDSTLTSLVICNAIEYSNNC